MSNIRKFIVACITVLVLAAKQWIGFDLEPQIDTIVDLTITGLGAFGVYVVPNTPTA